MGQIIIQDYTTKYPLQMIGKEAGICWQADVTDEEKNIKRAKDCVISEHGRTWEFPQVYMVLDGYSARVIREFYTHISHSIFIDDLCIWIRSYSRRCYELEA